MNYQIGVPKQCREKNSKGHLIFIDAVYSVLKKNGEAIITMSISPSKNRKDLRKLTRNEVHTLLRKFQVLEEQTIQLTYTIFLLHLKKV